MDRRRHRSPVFLLAGLLAVFPAGSRAADPPPVYDAATIAAMDSIVAAARKNSYAYDRDEFLSDVIGPRLSGSLQADAAVKYVAAQMTALGLDVHLEPVTVPHWVRGEESAELTDWPGRMAETRQKIVLTALGMSVATPPDGITAQVAVVKNFDELKALGTSVRGKIVLYDVVFDKGLAAAGLAGAGYGQLIGYRYTGPVAASKLGAIAVLVRSLGTADYRLAHTGSTATDFQGSPAIPAAAVSAEDAGLIERLSKNGAVTMHLTLTPKRLPDVRSANVIADLKGTEHPEQVVIVSGHLDSWDLATGATDDGAGVSQALGTMAVLHDLGLRPKRTIRCIAWMNEENGAAGGKQYAIDHASEASNTVAAIESDSGAERPTGFSTSLSGASGNVLDPIARALVANASPRITFDAGSETDIEAMVKLGVPAYAPSQLGPKYFDYHHTAADTFDKVDPADIAANTAVVATLAYGLANALVLPDREPFRDR